MTAQTEFNEGDRIKMVRQWGDPCPVEPGVVGTVRRVQHCNYIASHSEWHDGKLVRSEVAYARIHMVLDVDWDNGRTLSVLLPVDEVELVQEKEPCSISCN